MMQSPSVPREQAQSLRMPQTWHSLGRFTAPSHFSSFVVDMCRLCVLLCVRAPVRAGPPALPDYIHTVRPLPARPVVCAVAALKRCVSVVSFQSVVPSSCAADRHCRYRSFQVVVIRFNSAGGNAGSLGAHDSRMQVIHPPSGGLVCCCIHLRASY